MKAFHLSTYLFLRLTCRQKMMLYRGMIIIEGCCVGAVIIVRCWKRKQLMALYNLCPLIHTTVISLSPKYSATCTLGVLFFTDTCTCTCVRHSYRVNDQTLNTSWPRIAIPPKLYMLREYKEISWVDSTLGGQSRHRCSPSCAPVMSRLQWPK